MIPSFYRTHPFKQQIDTERFNLFMQEVGARMVATTVFALLLTLHFYDPKHPLMTAVWLIINAVIALQSWWLIRSYHRQQAEQGADIERWRYLNIYLSFLWGLAWAAVPWLFFSDVQLVEFLTVLLVVVVLCSMPSVSMGCYPEMYIVYTTLLFTSMATFSMTQPAYVEHFLPQLIVGIWASVSGFSLLTHRSQIHTIIQKVELQHAQQQLHAANQQKEHLIAMMGHDLKQPLNAARIYLKMADHAADELSWRQPLEQSLESAGHNLNKILEKSTLSVGEAFDYTEPLLLADLVDEALAILDIGQDVLIENCISRQASVSSDGFLCARIIENIIVNSLQHGRPERLFISYETKEAVLRFEAQGCRVLPDSSVDSPYSGYGVQIIQKLCGLLNIRFLCFQPATGIEITELYFSAANQ